MKTWYYKVHTNSHALSYKRILFRDAHYFEMHPHYHFITKTQKEKSSVRWMTPSLFLIPKRYPIEKSLFYSTTLIVVMIYYMVTVCRRQHPFREYIVVVFFSLCIQSWIHTNTQTFGRILHELTLFVNHVCNVDIVFLSVKHQTNQYKGTVV